MTPFGSNCTLPKLTIFYASDGRGTIQALNLEPQEKFSNNFSSRDIVTIFYRRAICGIYMKNHEMSNDIAQLVWNAKENFC